METETTAAAKKTWVAKKPAVIKVSRKWAKDLPDADKMMVPAGATLVAQRTGGIADCVLIAEATLDGQPVPPHLTFIVIDQWQLQPASPAAEPTPAKPEPEPVAIGEDAIEPIAEPIEEPPHEAPPHEEPPHEEPLHAEPPLEELPPEQPPHEEASAVVDARQVMQDLLAGATLTPAEQAVEAQPASLLPGWLGKRRKKR